MIGGLGQAIAYINDDVAHARPVLLVEEAFGPQPGAKGPNTCMPSPMRPMTT